MKNYVDIPVKMLIVGFCGICMQQNAHATTITDTVNITVGAFNANVQGYAAGEIGAASPLTTTDGYPYLQISSNAGKCKPNGCTNGNDNFAVSGFTSNPGRSWLTSVAWGGCTLTASEEGGFSYANGVASWGWPTDYCDFGATGSVAVVSVVHTLGSGVSGWILPKYQVVGITYAPPGAKSTATYSDGFLSGTATSSSSSRS